MVKRKGKKGPQKDSVSKFADDAWSLSKRAINGLNEIRKLINTEYKYIDNSTAGQSTSQSGVCNALTGIVQGTGVSQREGTSVKTEDLYLSFSAFISGSATRSTARVILFRDHENVGASPAGSDLLEQVGTAQAALSDYAAINTQMGPDGVGRFTILYDEVVALSVTGEQVAHREFQCKLGQHVRWSSTTAVSTREGALFMMILTNETTNIPTIDWYVRVRYVDN